MSEAKNRWFVSESSLLGYGHENKQIFVHLDEKKCFLTIKLKCTPLKRNKMNSVNVKTWKMRVPHIKTKTMTFKILKCSELPTARNFCRLPKKLCNANRKSIILWHDSFAKI